MLEIFSCDLLMDVVSIDYFDDKRPILDKTVPIFSSRISSLVIKSCVLKGLTLTVTYRDVTISGAVSVCICICIDTDACSR